MNLERVQTIDLLCEITRRTIANKDKEASPRSLLKLALVMTFVLGTRQSWLFAEELRNAADELENPERVHVQ